MSDGTSRPEGSHPTVAVDRRVWTTDVGHEPAGHRQPRVLEVGGYRQVVINRVGEGTYEVAGATFTIDYRESTAEILRVRKPADLLEAYEPLVRRCNPSRIVEIGIAGGGSTALLALLADPERLVALEMDPTPIPGLSEFLDARGLRDRVKLHFGVDQGDRDAVNRIIEAEFEEPLDLVVDDASHLLEETRASFETLFPRLRPGGLYVIEDWPAADRHAQWQAKADADDVVSPRPRPFLESNRRNLRMDERERPLSDLVIELVLVRSGPSDAVEGIEIGEHWAAVTRGPASLDPHRFRVSDLYTDYYGLLPAASPSNIATSGDRAG